MSSINSQTWQHHAWLNWLQSLLLLGLMAVFLGLLGWLLWGASGILALLISMVTFAVVNPAISSTLIMRMYRARTLTPDQAPNLYSLINELTTRAKLPATPTLYYIPSQMMNAFTVGRREQSAIAVTDGLLRSLEDRELLGVLAHEISHVRSNDIWVMGLADMFSRLTSTLSLLGQLLLLINLPLLLLGQMTISWLAILILIVAPTLSGLAQLGLSRTREYDADLNAAWLTGDPEGLARALLKIDRLQGHWLEQLFLPGHRIPDPSMLRTHPPTEERVRRLMALQSSPTLYTDFPASGTLPHGLSNSQVDRPPRWHIGGLWH